MASKVMQVLQDVLWRNGKKQLYFVYTFFVVNNHYGFDPIRSALLIARLWEDDGLFLME
jgi:hypothetical protein